jgi:uncharacterized protein (DUF58 family)
VRDALRGLTIRGRSFVAAGGAAALSALVLGERDLLRVAALLILLPLIAVIWVARTKYRLACGRNVTPSRAQVGTPATVSLRLDNLTRIPTGMLLVEDQVPDRLGVRPRFVVDRLRPRQTATVSYPVRADVRGRYELGPLSVRLTDPFGLVELTRSFVSVDRLTVTPVVVRLPPNRVGGEWSGSGDTVTRSAAVHGEDDAATRQYRQGDDLRKVHWRSTARIGELMVRREEQPWQARATVLLDTRAGAHRGEGSGSSLEWGISAVASIAVHLAQTGCSLRLLTDDGIELGGRPLAGDGRGAGLVLDHLAEVQASRQRSLAAMGGGLRRAVGEGLVVAVLGLLDDQSIDLLVGARGRSATCVAVLLDATTWIGLGRQLRITAEKQFAHSTERLTAAGWHVLPAMAGSRIDALWSSLGGGRMSVRDLYGPATVTAAAAGSAATAPNGAGQTAQAAAQTPAAAEGVLR